MKCPNCYREIPSDSKFCPDCGKRIEVRSNTNYSSNNNSSDAEIQRLKRLLAEKERVITSQRQTIDSNSPKYVSNHTLYIEGVRVTYSGYLVNGEMHGKGKMNHNGIIFEGEFRHNNLYNGTMSGSEPNGSFKHGEIRCGEPYGIWSFKEVDGNHCVRECRIRAGEEKGHGTIKYKDGSYYQGEVNDAGVEYGRGVTTFPINNRYNRKRFEGVYRKDGKKEGTLYYTNGDRCEGTFIYGFFRHGYCKYITANGSYEAGSFDNGKKTGAFVCYNSRTGRTDTKRY